MPYVRYAVPAAFWSLIAGTALIAGAAISNAPNQSIGPVTFSPDPNSPLTTHQVALIGLVVAVGAIVIAVVIASVVRRRVRALAPATVHESVTTGARALWVGGTAIGVPVTVLGALGVMPDLACAVIGAVLVISGAALRAAAPVVARRDAELGRPVSLAELLVGDRNPATRSAYPTEVSQTGP